MTAFKSVECSACYGRGYHQDYEDQWKCVHCDGEGYNRYDEEGNEVFVNNDED